MQSRQLTLLGESLLDYRIKESLDIIQKALSKSPSVPLIINFSGGKDSLVLFDLVQKATDRFICFYMISGIEFPESITFAQDTAKRFGRDLWLSRPSDYKGDFFERLSKFRCFPTLRKEWCNRDLKIRPQKIVLKRALGNVTFFKLNGVRRFESARRKVIYKDTARRGFILPDYDVTKDFMVFPILNWTDEDVRAYLKSEQIRIIPNPLYEKYSVSGCYWCPFYQCSIYERILRINPNLYDTFIEWEEKLNMPSVNGFVWLKDLKANTLKHG